MRRSKRSAAPTSPVVTASSASVTTMKERKVNQRTAAAKSGPSVNLKEESDISEYEATRLANIARNSEVLAGLGIATETSAIRAETKVKSFVKAEKRQREPQEPVRRSTRGKDSDGNVRTPIPVVDEPVDQHVAPSGPVNIRESGDAEVSQFADALKKLELSKVVKQSVKSANYDLTLGENTSCDFARAAAR